MQQFDGRHTLAPAPVLGGFFADPPLLTSPSSTLTKYAESSPSVSPAPISTVLPYTPYSSLQPVFVSPSSLASRQTNGDEIPTTTIAFSLVLLAILLYFIAYCNWTNRFASQAADTTSSAPSDSDRNESTANEQQHQQVDLVKRMTPQERKEYVTNFLKTQKFARNNLSSRRSSSFIVTQSSSFRLTNGANDIDIESSPSVSGMQQPTCAICLDRFRDGEDICSAQNKDCPHEYHLQCIFPWLLKSQDCPCCRRDYLAIEADVDEHHEETATSIVSTALHSI